MSIILTAAQMRAVEQAAIESGATSGLQLMERAGQAAVEAILTKLAARGGGTPPLPGHALVSRAPVSRALIFCGPGNNGGDGFVIARLLHDLGWQIDLHFQGEAQRLPPDARANHDRWLDLGPVLPFGGFDPWAQNYDLVIDALLGIGLSRPVTGPMAAVLDQISATVSINRGLSVAIDLPSGLCADSGRLMSQAPEVDLTVTFGFFKSGHFLADGPERCGQLICCDIGLSRELPFDLFRRQEQGARGMRPHYSALVQLADGRTLQPGFSARKSILDKGWGSYGEHKFGHGHALILGGPAGRSGAARLSARAALRIGAGLVTLGCPENALAENAARLDAIMLREITDDTALSAMLQDARINALCLGPALGTGAREAGLLRSALAAKRPTVLDADALSLLAQQPELFAALHNQCVLTPHGGEFARLFPDIAARLTAPPAQGPAFSRIDAAKEAASRAGCTVVLKGMDTVIAAPDGKASINAAAYGREAPWLATAGSGDVLAGIITGLLARGVSTSESAVCGSWLHVEAARAFGPGLIAEDLPEALPAVLRQINRWHEVTPDFGPPPAGLFADK
ncbi:NAD(P)H-hydrate dehydratase [Xinfangfangia sp. D13-10-4-6]|uniref:NAD(P)H-hydrate dehydratase n=1 Tax=Pseudogemmobacter hezensis TaxID=2737662 RepID=UPI0015537745|nr:NAD(P)H-hydrate dehydratase [Pseudogemmobacter hezensis]NPD15343.1 NAD(P)H-hydrate dehydratase [Pseudogemmobacter hezensis]